MPEAAPSRHPIAELLHLLAPLGIWGLLGGLPGYFIATQLAAEPKIEWFKVLNVVGLAFDLIGLLLLSRLFVASKTMRLATLIILSSLITVWSFAASIGYGIGAYFANAGPSRESVLTSAYWLYAAMFLLAAVAEDHVTWFEGDAPPSVAEQESRVKIFAATFLFLGVILQLVASVKDLFS